MATSVKIRQRLVETLRLDLVGPEPGSPYENEVLPSAPSRWYLTGFLVPFEAPETQKSDPAGIEEVEALGSEGAGDDAESPERASGRRAFFPSSMGISVLVPKEAETLDIEVFWGEYAPVDPEAQEVFAAAPHKPDHRDQWRRTQRQAKLSIPLAKLRRKPNSFDLPDSQGLKLVVSSRPVPFTMTIGQETLELVPEGTRSVSVFLVNHRLPRPDARKDESFVFQPKLRLSPDKNFVPRPNLRGHGTDDWDEQVADLQFRDTYEFAVGHGVATRAHIGPDGQCRAVETDWIPSAEVEKVVPGIIEGVELRMEALAEIESAEVFSQRLSPMVEAYGAWIDAQEKVEFDHPRRKEVARELLKRARVAKRRIAEGIESLKDPTVLQAFRLANRAMARAARQRSPQMYQTREPTWRPFQLAFLLMNLRGIAFPEEPDREVVDLLFFPTGGGKTEAYLGLAAFTLLLRRVRNKGISGAGVSVLMRYTLRLLTLDQLSRAATLICALELMRQENVELLGDWPFEIGLWVGMAATPNRMGKKGDPDQNTARARTIAFKNDDRKPSPIPLENCPWCGQKFTRNSFTLLPNPDRPTDLRVTCVNRKCDFWGNKALPVLAVDEPIYRRLPCFIIATVDKFANLPWVGHTGALFGKVDRYDKDGFYGPCDPGIGSRLEKPLLPPDLIIQDELHLISGPLGTMVGLYETALDTLCTRALTPQPPPPGGTSSPLSVPGHGEGGWGGEGLHREGSEGQRKIRPKIVASTATVRRASHQIRALFDRAAVEVFPPPGPDRRDSFFARTVPSSEKNARLYVGVAAQGRSLKVVLLRSYLALLAAAQYAYDQEGGAQNPGNPADPYMTLLGYFNSLRELGGSRRLVEDEVNSRLSAYDRRVRVGVAQEHFSRRKISEMIVELTSRESTNKVAEAKRRLALPFSEGEHVDVALATNMISVGLDIVRLGLMVVLGQPKTTAEYIQATSRVGRDEERPGLVLTLFNIHKPRDRSHYERFEAYHASFYRAVEATSVTPFSPRAVDRGLAAVVVSLARHGHAGLTAPQSAVSITTLRTQLGFVADAIASRAAENAPLSGEDPEELREKLRGRAIDLLDAWSRIAHEKQSMGAGLQYQQEVGGSPPLLFDPLDPELANQPPWGRKFKAQRSMRSVEPVVNLFVRRLDGAEADEEGLGVRG